MSSGSWNLSVCFFLIILLTSFYLAIEVSSPKTKSYSPIFQSALLISLVNRVFLKAFCSSMLSIGDIDRKNTLMSSRFCTKSWIELSSHITDISIRDSRNLAFLKLMLFLVIDLKPISPRAFLSFRPSSLLTNEKHLSFFDFFVSFNFLSFFFYPSAEGLLSLLFTL